MAALQTHSLRFGVLLAARVRPTSRLGNGIAGALVQRVEPGVGIRLQHPAEGPQMFLWVHGLAVRCT